MMEASSSIIMIQLRERSNPATFNLVHLVQVSRMNWVNVKSILQHCHMNGWRCALPKVSLLCQVRYETSLHVVGLQVCDQGRCINAVASPSGIGMEHWAC